MAALSLMGAPGIDHVSAQDAPPISSKTAELDSFEQRVREYLLKNPEVIMEALRILQERQRAAEAENSKRTIAERSDEILNDPAAPVGGNPEGDVTLVEFFDYNCPYCRTVAPTVTELGEADPDLRLVYKEYPILGPGSQFAARAALASRRQGKYVAMMWGMGLLWLLVIVVLLLAAAALVKYLLSGRRKKQRHD
jgi:protein-disulfide isomerase